MKRPIPKPTRSNWLSYTAMIVIGLILGGFYSTSMSSPWERAAGILSPLLIGLGIGGLIGSYFNLRRYRAQSPEDQREADRVEIDERNVAIRGRAAYVSMNITTIALGIGVLLGRGFGQDLVMWLCAGLFVVQWASFLIAVNRYEKRM